MSQSASQAAAFYRDAAKSGVVWTLRDANGYPAPMGKSKKRAMPFWSTKSRADKIIATVLAYSGCEPEELTLEAFTSKWIPDLEKNGMLVGLNWSGPKAVGYDLDPASVTIALRAAVG